MHFYNYNQIIIQGNIERFNIKNKAFTRMDKNRDKATFFSADGNE